MARWVLILGGFRWGFDWQKEIGWVPIEFDRRGFCGDQSFDWRIWRSGFDCVSFVPMGF